MPVLAKSADGNVRTGTLRVANAEYRYSYGRQNWFDFSAEEHRAVREAVGFLISPHSPNTSWPVVTRRRYLIGFLPMTWRFRPEKSCTRNGSMNVAALKPT